MQKLIQRKPTRLKNYDYSLNGYYFITVCTENRQKVFARIETNKTILNDIGKMVEYWWSEISTHFKGIEPDQYVIMPNHIHGIINIVGDDRCVVPIQKNKISDNKIHHNGRTHRSAPTISNAIQWFKTMTTNKYKRHNYGL